MVYGPLSIVHLPAA